MFTTNSPGATLHVFTIKSLLDCNFSISNSHIPLMLKDVNDAAFRTKKWKGMPAVFKM